MTHRSDVRNKMDNSPKPFALKKRVMNMCASWPVILEIGKGTTHVLYKIGTTRELNGLFIIGFNQGWAF